MAPLSEKKRQLEDGMKGKIIRPKKRRRKQQQEYHSSSEDSEDAGFVPVNLNDSEDDLSKSQQKAHKNVNGVQNETTTDTSDHSENSSASQSSGEDTNTDDDIPNVTMQNTRKKSKRNDPDVFSNSISKILSTKLSQSAKKDPLLSRNREATERGSTVANERLEKRAKSKLRAEKKEDLERGRVKDVLGLDSGQAGQIADEEKRLRKIAQKGVVKLFNAVRAAQVKAEQTAKEERKKGTIGSANREEKVNEMSKQGFLDLINGKSNISVDEAQD